MKIEVSNDAPTIQPPLDCGCARDLRGCGAAFDGEMTMLQDLFKRRYNTSTFKTRAWLKNVSSEDRKTFGRIGYDELMHLYGYEDGFNVLHRAGGLKRAAEGKRDRKGRFIGQKASVKR